MAVFVVTNSVVLVSDAEATGGYSSDGGGGAGPIIEPDYVWQGTMAMSRKQGTGLRGFKYVPTSDSGSALDMTAAADSVVLLKAVWANSFALDAAPSASHRIGDDDSNYNEYHIADDGTFGDNSDIVYPIKASWLISPINPNVTAWVDTIVASPDLTAVDYWSIQGSFGSASKGQNVIFDAIHVGPGLFVVGGDTAPAADWDSFLAHDEGVIGNRFGYFTTSLGIFNVFGLHVIGRNASGTNSATEFDSTGRTVLFPENRLDAGQTGLELDFTTAQTVLNFLQETYQGQGQSNKKGFYDTNTEADAGNDDITIEGHGYRTGNEVVYSKEGGSLTTGLTDTNKYFVNYIDDDTFSLHASKADAHADSSRIALTVTASPGENHSFTRGPDSRPVLTTVSFNGSAGAESCRFDGWASFDTTSDPNFGFVDCQFQNSGQFAMGANGTSFDGCTVLLATTNPGEAWAVTSDLENIFDCDFVRSSGHAIEIDTAGTYTFTNNSFTSYGPNPAEFDSTDGIDGGTEIITTDANHNLNTGDEVYYNDAGGGDVGLVDGERYYARYESDNELTLHTSDENAQNDASRVGLNTVGGNETHELHSAHAAIVNTSGGLVTINIAGGGDTATYRTVGNAGSTVVNNTVNLTVTVTDQAGDPVATAQVAIFDSSDTELMNEDTTAGGVATETYSFGTDEDVVVRVRKNSPGDTRYTPFAGTGTITAAGFTLPVTLIEDPNAA